MLHIIRVRVSASASSSTWRTIKPASIEILWERDYLSLPRNAEPVYMKKCVTICVTVAKWYMYSFRVQWQRFEFEVEGRRFTRGAGRNVCWAGSSWGDEAEDSLTLLHPQCITHFFKKCVKLQSSCVHCFFFINPFFILFFWCSSLAQHKKRARGTEGNNL